MHSNDDQAGAAQPAGLTAAHPGAWQRDAPCWGVGACALMLVVTMTLGVGIGSIPFSPAAVWRVVAGGPGWPSGELGGRDHYLAASAARVLLAAVVGAALTTASPVVQVLVRTAPADRPVLRLFGH